DSDGVKRDFSGNSQRLIWSAVSLVIAAITGLLVAELLSTNVVQIHSPRPFTSSHGIGQPANFTAKSSCGFERIVSETSSGSVTVKVEPSPRVLSTSIFPPRRSTNFLTI